MRAIFFATLSAVALAVTGCGARTDTSSNDSATMIDKSVLASNDTFAPAPGSASPVQTFANSVAASDAFEIAMARLAATNATSQAVKSFATQMIDAHTSSTEKLKSIAAAATPPIKPDATLTPEQQQKLDGLKSLNGSDFDQAFAASQIDAHQQALDLLKSYAATGEVAAFKNFASGLAPTVADHLTMAKALKP